MTTFSFSHKRNYLVFGTVFTVLMLFNSGQAQAQRFAWIDTEYILSQMPEFAAAQKQVETLSSQWAKEIEDRQKEIDGLYRNLAAEQALLTDEMRTQRESEIRKKEAELADFQKRKFGFEGEVFTKKKDLLKPIQDKVFDAVQKLAREKGYDVIFDKSGAVTMLYSNPKIDKSDEVIELMGIAKKAKEPNKK
jgi:outer membrane protein